MRPAQIQTSKRTMKKKDIYHRLIFSSEIYGNSLQIPELLRNIFGDNETQLRDFLKRAQQRTSRSEQ